MVDFEQVVQRGRISRGCLGRGAESYIDLSLGGYRRAFEKSLMSCPSVSDQLDLLGGFRIVDSCLTSPKPVSSLLGYHAVHPPFGIQLIGRYNELLEHCAVLFFYSKVKARVGYLITSRVLAIGRCLQYTERYIGYGQLLDCHVTESFPPFVDFGENRWLGLLFLGSRLNVSSLYDVSGGGVVPLLETGWLHWVQRPV
jgi:hypothetical protein